MCYTIQILFLLLRSLSASVLDAKQDNAADGAVTVPPNLARPLLLSESDEAILVPDESSPRPKHADDLACTLTCFNGGTCIRSDSAEQQICVCAHGYDGLQCQSCQGRVLLSNKTGVITDNVQGNYSANKRCAWLIDSRNQTDAAHVINLKLVNFTTECSWDHLYIYNGDSAFAPQLTSLSGAMMPIAGNAIASPVAYTLTVTSGVAYIYFAPDAALNLNGFYIEYSINDCTLDCGLYGTCVFPKTLNESSFFAIHSAVNDEMQCKCDNAHTGKYCELIKCQNCTRADCTTNNAGVEICACDGFMNHGPYCRIASMQFTVDNLQHPKLIASESALNSGRAAHRAELINNTLFVIGGYPMSIFENYVSFFKYDVDKQKFDILKEYSAFQLPVDAVDSEEATLRFEHASAVFDGQLIVYGGYLSDLTTVSSRVYAYIDDEWRLLQFAEQNGRNRKLLALAGHTMHLIDDRYLYTFFGYSPYLGYTKNIQVLDMKLRKYRIIYSPLDVTYSDDQEPMYGLYKHASVYDESAHRVYVYGGYTSKIDATSGSITDIFAYFDVKKEEWTRLPTPQRYLFGHSAYLINGALVILGGNAHNETDPSKANQTQCYSATMLVYDVVCAKWYDLPTDSLPYIDYPNMHRYSHSVNARTVNSGVINKTESYIFGGFNGRVIATFLKTTSGLCSTTNGDNEGDCLRQIGSTGQKCVWRSKSDSNNISCVTYDDAQMASRVESTPTQNEKRTNEDTVSYTFCYTGRNDNYLPTKEPERPSDYLKRFIGVKDDKRILYNPIQSQAVQAFTHPQCQLAVNCQQCTSIDCVWCGGYCHASEQICALRQIHESGIIRTPIQCSSQVNKEALQCSSAGPNCHECAQFEQCSYSNRLGQCLIKTLYAFNASAALSTFKSNVAHASDDDLSQEMTSNSNERGKDRALFSVTDGIDVNNGPKKSKIQYDNQQCTKSCEQFTDCFSCTQSYDKFLISTGVQVYSRQRSIECLWCTTLARCVPINSYVPSFTYGQCPEWTTKSFECTNKYDEASECQSRKTCNACLNIGDRCGWCDDGSETGVGRCLDGGVDGPLVFNNNTYRYEQSDECPATNWNFETCPPCNCNGHSHCSNESSPLLDTAKTLYHKPVKNLRVGTSLKCEACQDDTAGDHCDICASMHYGDARNNGSCTKCECIGKAANCNPRTGDCYCKEKGAIGAQCDQCDTESLYQHYANDTSCYFPLKIDYVYKFSVPSAGDDHYRTQMNFFATPDYSRYYDDVEFKLTSCDDVNARVNISVYSLAFELPSSSRTINFDWSEEYLDDSYSGSGCDTPTIVNSPWLYKCQNLSCSAGIHITFSHEIFNFHADANTTFFVYIYNFQTPINLRIQFSQPNDRPWWRFFLIFIAVFIGLMSVFGAGWWLRNQWIRRRHREQVAKEMDRMARRPFANIQMDLCKSSLDASSTLPLPTNLVSPSAVAVEPTLDYKAAVVTVTVRMPTGGDNYAPPGQSGLAVASVLCQLPPSYAQLLSTPDQEENDSEVERSTCATGAKSRLRHMRRRINRQTTDFRPADFLRRYRADRSPTPAQNETAV